MVATVVRLRASSAHFVVSTALLDPRSATVGFNVLQCTTFAYFPVTYCIVPQVSVIVYVSFANVAVSNLVFAACCRALLIVTVFFVVK